MIKISKNPQDQASAFQLETTDNVKLPRRDTLKVSLLFSHEVDEV
jgi:hypothetical protein